MFRIDRLASHSDFLVRRTFRGVPNKPIPLRIQGPIARFFSLPPVGPKARSLQRVENTSLPLLPFLAAFGFLGFVSGQDEDGQLKSLAHALGLELPEEDTPEDLFLLKEACFKATYEKYKQGGDIAALPLLNTITNSAGQTLLGYAILTKDIDTARRLIDGGVAVQTKDYAGNTPLHLAVETGLVDLLPVFALLPSFTSMLNTTNEAGKTPSHVAIQYDRAEVLQGLLNQKASLTPYKDLPPLALAVVYEAQNVFPLLIPRGDLSVCMDGKTLVHLAIEEQSSSMISVLLQKAGHLIEKKDSQGRTPVALAVSLGDEQALRILHQAGAHIAADYLQPAIEGDHLNCFIYLFDILKDVDVSALKADAVNSKIILKFIETKIEGKKWSPIEQPPEALVIKGGGPKGTAFIGALEELEKNGALTELKYLVGTSSGAIVSSLLAVGCQSKDIKKILENNPINTLLDPPEALQKDMEHLIKHIPEITKVMQEGLSNHKWDAGLQALKTTWHLLWHRQERKALNEQWNKGGLCSGSHFFKLINHELKNQFEIITGEKLETPYLTYGKLYESIETGKYPSLKHLFVVATRIGPNPENVTFSSWDPQYKNVVIGSTVRASMSIPIVFEPTSIYELIDGKLKEAPFGKFVDGGLLDNYPIDKLDKKGFKHGRVPDSHKDDPWVNPRTWGLNLYSPEEANPTLKAASTSAKSVIADLCNLFSNAETILKQNAPQNNQRTIDINNQGVSLVDFTINPERDRKLIESGRDAACTFLAQAKLTRLGNSPLYYNFSNIQEKKKSGRFNLFAPHPAFVNREDLCKMIEIYLGRNMCVLTGPPGQGKSVLANVYAHTHAEKYSLIFWIDSETEASETSSYHELATILKIPTKVRNVPSLSDLKQKVYAALEKEEKPFLLILDNVEALPNYSPKKGHLLVTSQKTLVATPLAVPAFTLKEACQLLESTTGQTCNSKMQKQLIDQQLYFSPLLVRMAAHYIASTPDMTLEAYSKSLDITKLSSAQESEYKKSLKAAYTLTKQRLAKAEPRAIEVLNQISFLAPDHIPVGLIDSYLELTNSEFASRQYQRDMILKSLEQYSLVKWDKMAGTFSLHRQTQEIIRLEETSAATMIRLLNDYPPVSQYNPMTRNTTDPFRKVLPHCVSLFYAPTTDPQSRAQLGLTLTRYYIESARALEQAEQCLQQVQRTIPYEAVQGRVHFYRGMIHFKRKNYPLAEEAFQEAQTSFEQDVNTSHYKRIEQLGLKCNREYQIAIAKCYLAQSLKNQKAHLTRAYTLLEECKGTMIKQLGEDHFDVGRIVREQAEVCLFQHDYSQARRLIQESLNSQRRIYGDAFMLKQPVAGTFTTQGDIYLQVGENKAAINAYGSALQVNQNIYGNNHIYVAKAYEKLAVAYRSVDSAMADHMQAQAQGIYATLRAGGQP